MDEQHITGDMVKRIRASQGAPRTISSNVLLGREKLIFIEHDGHRYQLRITKLRKLILTK